MPDDSDTMLAASDQALVPGSLLATWSPRSVLVFRALQVGDMLCAVPALRALRRALPQACITLVGLPWAAQFASRFSHLLDDFIAFPGHPDLPEQAPRDDNAWGEFLQQVQARQAELAIQLHGSGEHSNPVVRRFGAMQLAGFGKTPGGPDALIPWPEEGSEVERLLTLMRHLGAPGSGSHLEFPVLPQERAELAASGWAKGLVRHRYVCLHPGARFRDKCWPPACFAAIADCIAEEFGLQIVLTGSAKEADLTAAVASAMRHPAIDTASPLSLGAMAALIQDAALLVSNDTGVSHLAAAFRLPSVVVFNKADMARWAPEDRSLHRCLRDLDGSRVNAVRDLVRDLLSGKAVARE